MKQHQRYQDRLRGIPEEYETQITRKDGEKRWLQVKASPLRNKDLEVVGSIGILTDITDKKRLEEQLLWSQKMEAVSRLACGVTHDFKNLLTVITGYAGLLTRRLRNDDENHDAAAAILEAGHAASSITTAAPFC